MMISSSFFSLPCFSFAFPFFKPRIMPKKRVPNLFCKFPIYTPLKSQNNQLKLSKSGPGPTWLRAVRGLLRAAGSGDGYQSLRRNSELCCGP